ncbi:alpha-ketoglutarate-dependent dioxygenase AlkB [Mesorhizobium sp. BAC0120]|nr:alpha-ketoglutarate-dependent dioxygenase AlkB [Mesorhizobium sp. BAC0120]MDW6023531.1 alpha-ketoglutarate-dependent dioxygenase AlkB [Mesorhizobium sp. BAC0120]
MSSIATRLYSHHLAGMVSPKSKQLQLEFGGEDALFEPARALPSGFRYQPDLIGRDEETELVSRLETLPFAPFNFHGHLANRRVVGFGFRYDYENRRLIEAAEIPGFLLGLREKVAALADLPAEDFIQILINEYRPGAGIGWHRDKPQFEVVAGVSLLAPCSFRLRRKNGTKWERETITVEPRSAYLMTGPARHEWEHSIPPVSEHRYSITLRTLRSAP